jgi:hypothetical protein
MPKLTREERSRIGKETYARAVAWAEQIERENAEDDRRYKEEQHRRVMEWEAAKKKGEATP